MFIRKRSGGKNPSCQLIETFRDGGKVKQRIVANLGRHDNLIDASGSWLKTANASYAGSRWMPLALTALSALSKVLSYGDALAADEKFERDRIKFNNDPFWRGDSIGSGIRMCRTPDCIAYFKEEMANDNGPLSQKRAA